MGLGVPRCRAQRSTHIALGPVGLGQRRRWQPLGARFCPEHLLNNRPGLQPSGAKGFNMFVNLKSNYNFDGNIIYHIFQDIIWEPTNEKIDQILCKCRNDKAYEIIGSVEEIH